MIVDFNTRSQEQEFFENKPEITNHVDIFRLEIENILFTRKGECLGLEDFGLSLETLVHQFDIDNTRLRQQIIEQINLYSEYSRVFNFDVQVSFIQAIPRDTVIIEIFIENDLDNERVSYIFE